MPQHDVLYLVDIVEAARKVRVWLSGITRRRWDEDEILRNAVLRLLILVGEAASSISDDTRALLPTVAWRQIRGFRNVAVHHYFALDWRLVHTNATESLPSTEDAVMAFLRKDYPDIAKRLDEATEG